MVSGPRGVLARIELPMVGGLPWPGESGMLGLPGWGERGPRGVRGSGTGTPMMLTESDAATSAVSADVVVDDVSDGRNSDVSERAKLVVSGDDRLVVSSGARESVADETRSIASPCSGVWAAVVACAGASAAPTSSARPRTILLTDWREFLPLPEPARGRGIVAHPPGFSSRSDGVRGRRSCERTA